MLNQYKNQIEEIFYKLDLKDKKEEVLEGLKKCSKEEAMAMKFLYTAMPLSDIADYSFDTYKAYADHGVYLWNEGQYSSQIPEDIFLNYVLHHRINEEDISECRRFFYDQLIHRISGLGMKEAVLEVNYWCAEEATYQSTDGRTISPMTVYKSAFGRCGEESTFLVAALRSVGIPARQVYAPRWSHCDDNHAWVEVWCDGEWFFCGACEPEEILNKGWFTNASSRAMMVHSRWFSTIEPKETVIGKEGMARILNHLPRYALTKKLKVVIKDGLGNPIEDAQVDLEVLNYSELFPVASLKTDKAGAIEIEMGLGSIHIHVSKEEDKANLIVDLRSTNECEIVLGKENDQDKWLDFDMIAPVDHPVNKDQPTEGQKIKGQERFEEATKLRLSKVERLTLTNDTINDEMNEILKSSRGNAEEIQNFLLNNQIDNKNLKEKLLKTLTEKDYRDCKEKILTEHLSFAIDYAEDYEEDIFIEYLVNPRINLEPMTLYREFISKYYSQEQKETFKANPLLIWDYIQENIKEEPEKEYPNLVTSPVGCLGMKVGSYLSQKTLFVAICRTLGIAARLNPMDLSMEFYKDGVFQPVIKLKEKVKATIKSENQGDKWNYFENWSIAVLTNGNYQSLNLTDNQWNGNAMTLSLEVGQYRILTANRLPNGNIFSKALYFELVAGEDKVISLSQREAKLSEMLLDVEILDFNLSQEDGTKIKASSILEDRKSLLIWLEESKEPTEHILNELFEKQEAFRKLDANIIFIIKDQKALKDPTLARTLKVLPNVEILYDDHGENVNTLGRRMYVDPDKLPLIIVTASGLNGVYATSGYNVGTGDMLLRILNVN